MELYEALKTIIQEKGIGGLTDIRLLDMLEQHQVFNGQNSIEMSILAVILEDGLLNPIVSSVSNNGSDYPYLLNKVFGEMVQEYEGEFSRSHITDVFCLIGKALCMTQAFEDKTKCIDSEVTTLQEDALSTVVTEEDRKDCILEEDRAEYSADGKRLLKIYYQLLETDFDVKEGVQVICDGVFSDVNNLEIITFPKSLGYIGEYAFYNCSCIEQNFIFKHNLLINRQLH